jgi:2-phosphosulfolactate phosphatase
MGKQANYVARWELQDVSGVVVAVDVLRAFTTAAYAFAAGATSIYLVSTVAEAIDLAGSIPGALTMGEEHGLKPQGFDFSNSPVTIAHANVNGRVLVQRTSAGTQGVIAASKAERLFAASLVCASATAAAIKEVGPESPTYVITGRFPDGSDDGEDDLLTAQLIERARNGAPLDAVATANAVAATPWASQIQAEDSDHVHHLDVAYATEVDRFDFAMEVERVNNQFRMIRRPTNRAE